MSDLITLRDPRSPAAEAYRALRTSIQFAGVDAPIHTLLVTACAGEDGKSLAIANLAVTLAQGGQSTILADADLRRPAQHTLWKQGNEKGMTTMILDGEALREPPLKPVGVENLALLTSGIIPPNPADLFGSKRIDEVIAALKGRANLVVFDAPPVLAVTDTALLATKVDAVLLVIRAGVTRRDHARRAREMLEGLKVRVIGAALTNAPREAGVTY
ncbi:MAG TPA: CpsD/CapB family tyrosine-protein kinase [Aggregatilineales bacterium]|nr:CpsD/CapB family tyrosine-protein kinase [Aggregatilineales bacterium]